MDEKGDIMNNQENKNYEDKMLEAFIQKPDKIFWYKKAFKKFNFNGIDRMAWNWSWWAFFGSFWFLLYRKAYIPALVLFILNIISGIIPVIGPSIVGILAGGFSTYFIYKRYKELKEQIEAVEENEENRINAMLQMGGYHNWVVWGAIGLNILIFVVVALAGSYS